MIVNEHGDRTNLGARHGKLHTTQLQFDDHARITHRTMRSGNMVLLEEQCSFDTIQGTLVKRIEHLLNPFLKGCSVIETFLDDSLRPTKWVARNAEHQLPQIAKEEWQYGAVYSNDKLVSFHRVWIGIAGDTMRHTCYSLSYDSIGRLAFVEEHTCGTYTFYEPNANGTGRTKITIVPDEPMPVTQWKYGYADLDLPVSLETRYLGKEYSEGQRAGPVILEYEYDDAGNWTRVFQRDIDGGRFLKEKQKIKYR